MDEAPRRESAFVFVGADYGRPVFRRGRSVHFRPGMLFRDCGGPLRGFQGSPNDSPGTRRRFAFTLLLPHLELAPEPPPSR